MEVRWLRPNDGDGIAGGWLGGGGGASDGRFSCCGVGWLSVAGL